MKSLEVARLTDAAELKRFINGVLEHSPAQQTEVMVTEWDSALTRFANNGIHQNVAERNVSVRVRVVKDGKTGVASINQLSQAAATDVSNRAARWSPCRGPRRRAPLKPGPMPPRRPPRRNVPISSRRSVRKLAGPGSRPSARTAPALGSLQSPTRWAFSIISAPPRQL
jgi:predicted Zn-dependent protease